MSIHDFTNNLKKISVL